MCLDGVMVSTSDLI